MFDISSFYQAGSVRDALDALARSDRAMVISGGTDVLVQCREGKLAGCELVSVHGLPELRGVRAEADGTLVIGAATPFAELARSETLLARAPILARAADTVGGPQTRVAGTIGGNVCNGAVSADTAPSLLCLEARLQLESLSGTRLVPLAEFYTGPGKTVRRRDELLTRLLVAREDYEGCYGRYIKYGKREAMEISTLGCAALVRLSPDKRAVERLRLAFGVAAPTPARCPGAEALAAGRPVSHALAEQVADAALAELHPRESWRAGKAFREQLIRELCQRALWDAILQAGGKRDV